MMFTARPLHESTPASRGWLLKEPVKCRDDTGRRRRVQVYHPEAQRPAPPLARAADSRPATHSREGLLRRSRVKVQRRVAVPAPVGHVPRVSPWCLSGRYG